MTRGHVELTFGFVECDQCRGTLELCSGCTYNMERAQLLSKEYDTFRKLRVTNEALLIRRDELIRANNREILRRRTAQAQYNELKHECDDLKQYATVLEDRITELTLKLSEFEVKTQDTAVGVTSAEGTSEDVQTEG